VNGSGFDLSAVGALAKSARVSRRQRLRHAGATPSSPCWRTIMPWSVVLGRASSPTAQQTRRHANRRRLFCRDQQAPGAPGARGFIRRRRGEGHGQPVWRKAKGVWDAWNGRSLADEPIVRLILDGMVVRVRLDRQANDFSAGRAGRPQDAQKILLAGGRVRRPGGRSSRSRQNVARERGGGRNRLPDGDPVICSGVSGHLAGL
jgi:hypothetical protein